jgi:hypothetical protein
MRFITPLLIGLFCAASVVAQENTALNVWLQDEFQEGLMPGWAQVAGTWTAEAGTLTGRGGAEHLAMLHGTFVMSTKQAVLQLTVHTYGGGLVFNAEHPNSLTNSQVVKVLQGGLAMGYIDFTGNYIETRIVYLQDIKLPVTMAIYTDPVKSNYSVLLDNRNVGLEEMRFNSGYAGPYTDVSPARFGGFRVSGSGAMDLPQYFVKSNKRQLDNLSYMCTRDDGILIVNPKLNIAQQITSVGTYVNELQVSEENAVLRGIATDETGRTFIVDAGNNALRIFDNRGGIERIITQGLDDPRDVSVANGKIYVLDKAGIAVFDAKSLASTGRKAGGLFKDAKGLYASGDKLYVADFGNGQVLVLSASDFSVDIVIKEDLVKPWGVVVEPKSGDIYVADPGAVAVFHFDKKGGFIERIDPITIRGFISPRALLIRGDMLYVADLDRILGFKKGVLTIRPTLRIN